MRFILYTAVVLTISSLSPVSASAYFTTDQQAFTLDQRTGFYTIEFTLGHQDHDIHVPIRALQNGEVSDTALSYTLATDAGDSVNGTAQSIVLSRAPVVDGMYVVPRGFKYPFTLFVAYTPETEIQNAYTLNVTHLPFSFDGDQSLKLNPSELQYYKTPSVTLGQVGVQSVTFHIKPNGAQMTSSSPNVTIVSSEMEITK